MDLDRKETTARANGVSGIELLALLIKPLAREIEFTSFESDPVAMMEGVLEKLEGSRVGAVCPGKAGKAARELSSDAFVRAAMCL